jgi:hypothetical protein
VDRPSTAWPYPSEELVAQNNASWNLLSSWLRLTEAVRQAAQSPDELVSDSGLSQ